MLIHLPPFIFSSLLILLFHYDNNHFFIQKLTGYTDGAVYLFGRETTSGKSNDATAGASVGSAGAAEGSVNSAAGGLGWSAWSQVQLLTRGDFGACELCQFGYSVGLQGDWLAGGANGELASWGVSACKPTSE